MHDWLDEDEGADIERRVKQLVDGLAAESDPLSQKNISHGRRHLSSETTKVRVRVDAKLKTRFAELASQGSARIGEYFTEALITRSEGGRMRRVSEKLDELESVAPLLDAIEESDGNSEDVAELLELINGSVPQFVELLDDSEGELNSVERDTIAICNRLPDRPCQFVRDELDEAIRVQGKTSKPTIEDYRERVLDKLDFAPHPRNNELLMPREEAERFRESDPDALDPDAPAIDRKAPAELTREEMIEGAKLTLARVAADRPQRKAGWEPAELNRHAFGNQLSDGGLDSIVKAVAEAPGFKYQRLGTMRKKGPKVLCVNLAEVSYDLYEKLESGEDTGSSAAGPSSAIADGGVIE